MFATEMTLTGPPRTPRQMLAAQEYSGHASIHDDETAARLGWQGGTIEGPTHFSQVVPLAVRLWGQEFFETGYISAHYQNACVEGDEVIASLGVAGEGARHGRVDAAKPDGTPVLTGSVGVGADGPTTEVVSRIERLRPAGDLVIMDQLSVGQRGPGEQVAMAHDQHMGHMYPFSLAEKLDVITEPHPWYTAEGGASSPWGRAVIPMEMISVLTMYTSGQSGFATRQPSVGLFADQEIRLIDGPLFVDEQYRLEREIVALSQSRRTESYWMRTEVYGPDDTLRAVTIMNMATMKESYPDYPPELLG